MASEYLMNKVWTGVESITLTKNLYLESGGINNSSPSIDVTLGGISTIGTVPAGRSWDISNIKIQLLGNNITGTLQASIGTNGSANNIVPNTTFTGLASIGQIWRIATAGLVDRANAGDTVSINITNPVTGVGAIVNVFLIGEIN